MTIIPTRQLGDSHCHYCQCQPQWETTEKELSTSGCRCPKAWMISPSFIPENREQNLL